MKKLVKIVVAAIVVLVIVVTALMMLVDPNEYRSYLVQQVKKNTGYTLAINGDLRWHIWPQVSILAADISITAPNSPKPLATAANMRLDVALMPLFSKKLSINHVVLNNAVISLTDDTRANLNDQTQGSRPVTAVADTTEPSASHIAEKQDVQQTLANFNLNKFEVVDSIFIFQQGNDINSLLTVRDIDIKVVQRAHLQFNLTANGQMTRDQLNVMLAVEANLDLQNLPLRASVNVNQLDYQLKGSQLADIGIEGEASFIIDYQSDKQLVDINNIKLRANDSQLAGQAVAKLQPIPDIFLKLTSDNINIDKILASTSTINSQNQVQQGSPSNPAAGEPATNQTSAEPKTAEQELDLRALQNFNAQLLIDIKELVYSGVKLNNVTVALNNKQGKVDFDKIYTQLFSGSVNITGSLDATDKLAIVRLKPTVDNVDLTLLSQHFDLPRILAGKINLTGNIAGQGLSQNAIKYHWDGNAQVRIGEARLNDLNLQQIIQQAVALINKQPQNQDKYQQYTELQQLDANIKLHNGMLFIEQLLVDSKAMNINGGGSVSLNKMYCNMALNVKIMQGWQGKQEIVNILSSNAIPIRIYGPCKNLSYQVDVDKILQDQLKQQAAKAINRYLGKTDESTQDAAKKILGALGIKRN